VQVGSNLGGISVWNSRYAGFFRTAAEANLSVLVHATDPLYGPLVRPGSAAPAVSNPLRAASACSGLSWPASSRSRLLRPAIRHGGGVGRTGIARLEYIGCVRAVSW
jgi:hypothetical protein